MSAYTTDGQFSFSLYLPRPDALKHYNKHLIYCESIAYLRSWESIEHKAKCRGGGVVEGE
jgi:hypothetical protein